MDRRRFGAWLGAAALAALGAVPSLLTLFSRRRAEPAWRAVALRVESGVVTPFSYEIREGWETRREVGFLVRDGEGTYALSSRCTHLGCRVRLENGAFACPCHGGRFDLDGAPVAGPPREPLARLSTRVVDGRLEVLA